MEVFGYSVAGEETVIAMPQLDVCFDIGKAPDQVIPINNVLLTHGHMDHTAGIAYYLSHRNFCGQTPGTVLAPANLTKNIQTIIDAHGRLDGQQIPANIIAVEPGQDHKVKPDIYARVFPVKHSRGAVGYCVLEKRKKLKEEYTGLNGPQIVELKKQGIEIDRTVEIPFVTYLGDTNYVDFSQLEYVKNSKILITECTFFLDEHLERASEGKHIHVNEFAGMVDAMENEHIVITHLSQRISTGQAKSVLRKKLSKRCYDKVIILMEHQPRIVRGV
jgi:ribonuclease Z